MPADIMTEKFVSTSISHPKFITAYNELASTIQQAAEGSMIFLFGPSGVGKTKLLKHLQMKFTQHAYDANRLPPDAIPVVFVEAPAPDTGQFSWKEFYRRTLISLLEPLPDKKLVGGNIPSARTINDSRTPANTLRLALENTIKYRHVEVMLVDEAQHIALRTNIDGIARMLDYLKSLANMTKTVIVLAGTYELLAFRNLSGQLSRRSIDIHFPRYRSDNPHEYMEFINIINTFQNKLHLECEVPLVNLEQKLYLGSCGCIGILKPWIDRAVKQATISESRMLTVKNIDNTAHTYDQLLKLYKELEGGEKYYETGSKPIDELKKELGLFQETSYYPDSLQQNVTANTRTKKRMPGIPNPKRIKIGK